MWHFLGQDEANLFNLHPWARGISDHIPVLDRGHCQRNQRGTDHQDLGKIVEERHRRHLDGMWTCLKREESNVNPKISWNIHKNQVWRPVTFSQIDNGDRDSIWFNWPTAGDRWALTGNPSTSGLRSCHEKALVIPRRRMERLWCVIIIFIRYHSYAYLIQLKVMTAIRQGWLYSKTFNMNGHPKSANQ